MLRILLPCCAAFAASTSPQDAAMRSSNPASKAIAQAAQGPIPEPVSAAANPAPTGSTDSPEEARGRRTLSTAFVRVGPDRHLTVTLRSGKVLVLRDVVMHPRKYCGHMLGGPPGAQFCGRYADVAAARPGGVPAGDEPVSAASHPVEPERGVPHRP